MAKPTLKGGGQSMLGILIVSLLLLAPLRAEAVTFALTADKATYRVGETVVLSVFGDPEGAEDSAVRGRLLFDAEVASYLDSVQQPLTTSFGIGTWGQQQLVGGVDAQGRGFADAFDQTLSVNPGPAGNTLTATVTLIAEAVGTLDVAWQLEPGGVGASFDFFGLTNAPGLSVSIVPEPSTLVLLALGLGVLAAALRGCSNTH